MASFGSVSTGPSATAVTGTTGSFNGTPTWSGSVASPYQRPAFQGSPGGGMFAGFGFDKSAVQPMTPDNAIAIARGMPGSNGAVAPGPRPFSDPTGYNPIATPTVQPVNGPQGMPYKPVTSYASVGQSMSPQTPWMPPSLPSLNQRQAFNALGGPTASGASSVQGMLSQLLMALRGNVGF